MARLISGKHEKQRARQARYRNRLEITGQPEVAAVDTAAAMALAKLAQAIDDGKGSEKSIKLFEQLRGLAGIFLRDSGYDREISDRLVNNRIVWLKETMKNPNASTLQKRGFPDA